MKILLERRLARTSLLLVAMLLCQVNVSSAAAVSTSGLNLRIENGLLSWDSLGAESYLVADAYTESEYYTTDTSVDLSAIAPDGDLSITVAAVTRGRSRQ